jgi:DNA polymerase IIIc chi subunit
MILEFFDLERIGMKAGPALAWLAEKYSRPPENKVLIWTENWQQALELDDWLWTYSPASFLPHGLARDAGASQEPILITPQLHNLNKAATLLLAFNPQPASWLPPLSFTRAVELIPPEDGPARSTCRTRYSLSGKLRQYERLYTSMV